MWGGSRAPWKRRFSCYGPWETAESCVVRTSASVYRPLQESPRQPPGGMSTWGPPPPPPLSSSSPPASGRLLKSESEDSGVEMASNEHSPSTPLGSESSFSLDGLPAEKSPPGEEPGTEPPRAPRKKLVQAAQRSRRQRLPARCPRQLGRRNLTDPAWDPRDAEEPDGAVSAGEGRAAVARLPGSPRAPRACPQAVPGQGLRYLEHVCQMLERLARLQQDNRLLRQEAADARHTRPDATPPQDPVVWRFRPRSRSDSQAPAPDPGPCRRTWGYSASSPSLLEPSEGAPTPDKDGRSHWGRVKVLLTRLTRRSLRGGRCR
ncbi:uncharacterized protein C8orf58 homolog isoform X2 [Athene noctua]|uniref:uncharacterized protein C8orf58 homolog isoform X2 n=1 Tax=Athene noctua TaxID=126797 RepID=UPI003EB9ABE0